MGVPLEFEFEGERQEPDKRVEVLITTVRASFRRGNRPGRSSYVDGKRVDSSDIAADMVALDDQERRLAGGPGIVVEFPRDAIAVGRGPVDVPVDIDIPRRGPTGGYLDSLMRVLAEAGLKPRFAGQAEVKDAFLDRAAESIALRALEPLSGAWPANVTMVSSTRPGDDILCAKGWFLSTGSIFGQSTCPVSVPPGRYALGVSRGSVTRYHEHLFNLPIDSIHLELP